MIKQEGCKEVGRSASGGKKKEKDGREKLTGKGGRK